MEIEYIKKVGNTMNEILKYLNENPHIDFTCEKLIKTVNNTQNNGEKKLSKLDLLSSIYKAYLLTFYIARPDCKILNSLISYIYQIDKKIYTPVCFERKRFVKSLQKIVKKFINSEYSSFPSYKEAIFLYLKIHNRKNKNIFL